MEEYRLTRNGVMISEQFCHPVEMLFAARDATDSQRLEALAKGEADMQADGAETVGPDGRSRFEVNSCVPLALSFTCNLPYWYVVDMLYGQIGVFGHDVDCGWRRCQWLGVLHELGVEYRPIALLRYVEQGDGRIVNMGPTITQFCREHTTGAYLFRSRGHLIGVRNGEKSMPKNARHRGIDAYKLTPAAI